MGNITGESMSIFEYGFNISVWNMVSSSEIVSDVVVKWFAKEYLHYYLISGYVGEKHSVTVARFDEAMLNIFDKVSKEAPHFQFIHDRAKRSEVIENSIIHVLNHLSGEEFEYVRNRILSLL